MDLPLIAQLSALMHSESYEDWWRAWELIRDHLPEGVTTFRECDIHLRLNVHGLVVTNLLYDLDMALHNAQVDDARWTAKRAELARWVYTHFTEESDLHLGNFRGYEAEAIWDMGQTEQAEARFQELIEVLPHFAWGYIWWADCYWMSDWSYEHGPDYDRAESLYRQALTQSELDYRSDVEDRLEDLYDEKEYPENRERIKQARLQHRQRRKSLE